MSMLDRPEQLKKKDPESMAALLETFPEQLQTALGNAAAVPLSLPRHPAAVVITGLGGSAIGGDIARSVAGSGCTAPLLVNRGYDLPGFIDSSSLVVACSYSGNTEETISAYKQARAASAAIVCITSGGQLEAMAAGDAVPVVKFPAGLPPRAALGYALVSLLIPLGRIGVIPDMSASVIEAVGVLSALRERYRVETPFAANRAKAIADSMHGNIAVIYGSSGIMDGTAYRWRTQIAENAKNLAFHHLLPEMNHNELVGWEFPEPLLRRVTVVLLRDKGDHPQVGRRFELTRDLIEKRAGTVHDVWSDGESILARVLSVIYLGDYVSFYLALLNDVDPTPVRVIELFKRKLESAG